jgi:phosphatidylglycerophosphate synthase
MSALTDADLYLRGSETLLAGNDDAAHRHSTMARVSSSDQTHAAGAVSLSIAQRYPPRPLTDGERWTAQTLTALRRGRYRPRAWVAFLHSSLERSAANRQSRPEMVRQARVWGAAGALVWILACTAARGRRDLRPRPLLGLLWWFAVWRMLDWHLGMAESGDGEPRLRLSPADAVTLTRLWLVPAASATARSTAGLPIVILLGGATDLLDGRLARRHGRTRLGRDLDTTADLAFLTTVAIAARATGRITPVAFTAITGRQALGLIASFGAAFARARRPPIRGRAWGAALRIGGLAIGATGSRGFGTALVVAGSVVPPRSTASDLSRA